MRFEAYEEALALYRGDLLESVAVPTYPWLYDGAGDRHFPPPGSPSVPEDVRLRSRTCMRPVPPRTSWAAPSTSTRSSPPSGRMTIAGGFRCLRVQGRRGDAMGLEASVGRLRTALVELGQTRKARNRRACL